MCPENRRFLTTPCYGEATERRELLSKRGKALNKLMELDLSTKLKLTEFWVKRALAMSKRPVVSCSWGVDSMVLLYIVHKHKPNITVLYNDTGVDYPETQTFMKKITDELNLNVIIAKSEKWTYWTLAKKYGYPHRTRSWYGEPMCCKYLKTEPTKKALKKHAADLNFVGLIGDEGIQRRYTWLLKGTIYYSSTWNIYKCIPLIWWKKSDIWAYTEEQSIPVHPAYKKYDLQRLGCVPCTNYIGWEKELSTKFPALYQKIQHDRGVMLIEDFSGVIQ